MQHERHASYTGLPGSLKYCVIFMCIFFPVISLQAQCPANLDFETGTFEGWTCYKGTVHAIAGENFINLTPVPGPIEGRQVMLSASPGDGFDEYGGFPKNCPNGSGHSIRLGNNDGNGEAEGLSYDFTIPITADKYRLTYNYAIVIQDPGHHPEEQPRMAIEVYNLTDEVTLNCSSFSFIAAGGLPGFQVSPNPGGESPVLYRNWSSNTINLDGLAGKQIRFFVKTTDCTFEAHWGYAYIDVTTECSSDLEGSSFCMQDTAVNVAAPGGYLSYRWFNNNFSQVLGTDQVLHIEPLPVPGTIVAVELTPYPGYGCMDTLFQKLDTIVGRADAGADKTPCNLQPVQIGGQSFPGLIYSWEPATALSSTSIPNPIATPHVLTDYILTLKSRQGGCVSKDTVRLNPQVIDNNIQVNGSSLFCLGNSDAAVLIAQPADSIQWFMNSTAIAGEHQQQYHVTQSGDYYAYLYNDLCADPLRTNVIPIEVDTAKPGMRYRLILAAKNFPVRLEARHFGETLEWHPAINLDHPFEYNPYFRGLESQEYTIEIKTASGCVTVDTQFIKTYKEIALYVPSVFTPNGDGLNDYLKPLLLGFKKVHYFRIYNRWGKLLFETNSDLPGWNGRVAKTIQEPQTIIWSIEAEDIDGKIHRKHGSTIMLP